MDDDTSFVSVLMGLVMPELGATREAIVAMALAKVDACLSSAVDELTRQAALALRAALERWTSTEPTEEVREAAEALLVAEGHGDVCTRARTGMAWAQVITLINDLAHPESHTNSPEKAREAATKLDAYLSFGTDDRKRAAALAVRAALATWTSSEQPSAVTEAARAMLLAEDYASFHAELIGFTSLSKGRGGG